MSVIATAVRHLIAAGVTGEALVQAVAEMEADLRAEPKPRSAGAIRQERYMERKRQHASQMTEGDGNDGNDAFPALSPPPNEINSNPPAHSHPEHTPRARKADDFPRPDWADPLVWADLKRNRRTKKLTNTATAHRQFVAAVEGLAEDGWPPGEVLRAIVAKGWGGAHDPRDDRKPTNGRSTPQHFSGNSTLQELAERSIAGR